ncbi:helix-turn-helix domain-containing protein [Sphingomonas sp. ac-8]|uniref:helix-turn-helix domain-containing protein n=1 Tax=Sphingomonas sp. ac-8 TaxID=3242977 RepID=UPI003A7FF110
MSEAPDTPDAAEPTVWIGYDPDSGATATISPPLTAGAYLRLRREAAGMTIEQVVGRLSFGPSRFGELLIDKAERDERSLTDDGLQQLRPIFPFDPFVYQCLRDDVPAGRICRSCGCSWIDGCLLPDGPCAWTAERRVVDDRCTRCAGALDLVEGARTALLATIPLPNGDWRALREAFGRMAVGFHGMFRIDAASITPDVPASELGDLAVQVLEHARPGEPHTRTLRFVTAAPADPAGAL